MRFFAFLRDITGCKEAELPEAANVRSLGEKLGETFGPRLGEKIFAPGREALHPEIIILVNGRHTAHLGGIDAPLKNDDVISIFPVVAGG